MRYLNIGECEGEGGANPPPQGSGGGAPMDGFTACLRKPSPLHSVQRYSIR